MGRPAAECAQSLWCLQRGLTRSAPLCWNFFQRNVNRRIAILDRGETTSVLPVHSSHPGCPRANIIRRPNRSAPDGAPVDAGRGHRSLQSHRHLGGRQRADHSPARCRARQHGDGLLGVSAGLHAGDAPRRLVHRPLRAASGAHGAGFRLDGVRRPDGRRGFPGEWSLVSLAGTADRAVDARPDQRAACIRRRREWSSTIVPPQSRAMANGLVTFAACVGIAATYFAFGMLIDRFDWPVAFLISSGLTFLVALVWTFGTRPTRDLSNRAVTATRASFRSLGPPAGAPPPECDLHHAQLCGLWLLSVPVLLLDPVLFRDDPAAGPAGGARVFHDDHAGHGSGHARRRVAVRSRPTLVLTSDCGGRWCPSWG